MNRICQKEVIDNDELRNLIESDSSQTVRDKTQKLGKLFYSFETPKINRKGEEAG